MKTFKFNYALAGILALCVMLAACNSGPGSSGTGKTDTTANSAAVTDTMAQDKTRVQSRVTELDTRTDTALAHTDRDLKTSDAKTKVKLQQQRADLSEAKSKLKTDLDKFGNATANEWNKMKASVSKDVDSLEKKLKLD